MKTLSIIVLAGLLFVSCKKELALLPQSAQPAMLNVAKLQDTLADGAFFRIRLQKDSSPIDETVIVYRHTAPLNYDPSVDAEYFQGFGIASLSSITNDNIPCAIQTIPFSENNTVKLNLGSQNDNNYILRISALAKLPASLHIWLKDSLLKDSLDLRIANYAFKVNKCDTSSFGTGRFKIIVR